MSMCIRPWDSRFSDSRHASASTSPPGSAPGPRDRYPVSTTLPHRGFVFRDFIRGKHHIHGIPDIPMNQMQRDGFPCRDFPNRSDLLHASLQMDGPDPYRGFETFEVLVPSTSGMPISRCAKRRWRLISATCPLPTDGPDPCRDFAYRDSQLQGFHTFENSDSPGSVDTCST
jgi:hypothetical protein